MAQRDSLFLLRRDGLVLAGFLSARQRVRGILEEREGHMSLIDRQRIEAVKMLEAMGST